MAQEQKQPRKSSEAEESTQDVTESDIAEVVLVGMPLSLWLGGLSAARPAAAPSATREI